MTRRHIVLLLWILGILLPIAWLSQYSPGCVQVFGFLFAPLWMHLLMHALLFAVLGYLAACLLQQRFMATTWAAVLGALPLVVVIAALQEAGLRPPLRVMVGGAPISQEFADRIGADGYGATAPDGVELARRLMNA